MRLRLLVCAISITLLSSLLQAATLDSLIAQLRVKLGQTDSLNSSWTNTDLRNCFNMAQDLVSVYSGGVQRTDTIQGTALTYIVRGASGLDSSFISLAGPAWLWRVGGPVTPIQFVPSDSLFKAMDRNTKQSMGIDKHIITEVANTIAVFPPIDTTDTLLVPYYAFPTYLTGTDECDFDLGWERVVVISAVICAWENVNNHMRVQFYIQERDKQLAAMAQSTTRRPQEQSER